MKELLPIIDGLVHLEQGLKNYGLEVTARNIVFNFVDQYKAQVQNVPASDAITLIFDFKNNLDFVQKEIKESKIAALKIHSRDQKIQESDYPQLIASLSLVSHNLPILIDSFYYGPELEFQPSLKGTIQIAKAFPERKIVIVHSGGHKLLEYFFHLRPLENIYYDLSFSLQYLKDSSVFTDLKKLVRFTDKSRLLFGSDYPYASPKNQAQILEDLTIELGFNQQDKLALFHDNAKKLYF